MGNYYITRFFDRSDIPDQILKTGLTLEEARAHCKDPETSAKTATSIEAVLRTKNFGFWFDGYEQYRPEKELKL